MFSVIFRKKQLKSLSMIELNFIWQLKKTAVIAWKVSVFGVFLDRMRKNADQKHPKYGQFWRSLYDPMISIIQTSPNLTDFCFQSCCKNLVNIVFPEREVQCFTKITQSCNDDVIIIFETSLNWIDASEYSSCQNLVIILFVAWSYSFFSKGMGS